MPSTAQQAYDAIKSLEQQGSFPLPLPSATHNVGSFDAATGSFHYAREIFVQKIVETRITVKGDPIRRPPIRQVTEKSTILIGQIQEQTPAVQLFLRFDVVNPQGLFTVTAGSATVSADPGSNFVTVTVTDTPSQTFGDPEGDDEGPIFSTPPVFTNVFDFSSGDAQASIRMNIVRLPVFTAGAFTLPAVPIALIYAPPQGLQSKNYAEYSDMSSASRNISTSAGSSASNKPVGVSSAADFLGKISGAAGTIGGFVVGGPAGAIVGKAITAGLNALSFILSSTTTSMSGSLTTTEGHGLRTTYTATRTLGSAAGLGPGLGDRFVYVRNVKVVWLLINNELNMTLLGDDGIREFAAQQLLSDLTILTSTGSASGTGPITNLDDGTIQTLLKLDPFVGNLSRTLNEPRFVRNDRVGGNGTGQNGDALALSHDVTVTDSTTRTNITTTITDFTPGLLDLLFTTNDQATENGLSLAYTAADETVTDRKRTATVVLFAEPNEPPYDIGVYFDRLFGTFAFTSEAGGI